MSSDKQLTVVSEFHKLAYDFAIKQQRSKDAIQACISTLQLGADQSTRNVLAGLEKSVLQSMRSQNSFVKSMAKVVQPKTSKNVGPTSHRDLHARAAEKPTSKGLLGRGKAA